MLKVQYQPQRNPRITEETSYVYTGTEICMLMLSLGVCLVHVCNVKCNFLNQNQCPHGQSACNGILRHGAYYLDWSINRFWSRQECIDQTNTNGMISLVSEIGVRTNTGQQASCITMSNDEYYTANYAYDKYRC